MLKKSVFLFAVVFLLTSAHPAFSGEAGDQLKATVGKILAVLQDQSMKSPDKKLERRNRIFKVVEERFDFTEMARRSLGEFWPRITEAEQKDFELLFSNLLEAMYITKIEKFSDETVNFSDDQPKGEQYILVHTEIVSGSHSTPVDYSLRSMNGQWLVYDVNIEGFSLVTNFRTEFADAFRKEGLKGLMNRLNERIKALDQGEVS